MLTFDLAVTPSEAFAKFWEDDYYARVLEEKCSNEDVTFEPWRHDNPKTRKVNARHPLAKDISMPGISFPSLPPKYKGYFSTSKTWPSVWWRSLDLKRYRMLGV